VSLSVVVQFSVEWTAPAQNDALIIFAGLLRICLVMNIMDLTIMSTNDSYVVDRDAWQRCSSLYESVLKRMCKHDDFQTLNDEADTKKTIMSVHD
jgi:hypothetical protein